MTNNNPSTATPFMIIGLMFGMFIIPTCIKRSAHAYYEAKKTKAGYYFYEKKAVYYGNLFNEVYQKWEKDSLPIGNKLDSILAIENSYSAKCDHILDSLDKTDK